MTTTTEITYYHLNLMKDSLLSVHTSVSGNKWMYQPVHKLTDKISQYCYPVKQSKYEQLEVTNELIGVHISV